MPNGEDKARIAHRLDQLERQIKEEWTDADIQKVPADHPFNPEGIRVEFDRQKGVGRGRVAIIFAPDRPLMSDTDSPYENIFVIGIQRACELFNDVPNEKNIFQGTIVMKSVGVNFELYTGQDA